MAAKSKIDDLDPAIRAEVLDAIKRGRTIDEIVALIRGMGGDASRSSVGRYTKSFAELAKQQRDMRSVAEAFGREFGDADDHQGRMMVQLLTSTITRSIMPIAAGGDDIEELGGLELSRLAKAVKDATSASKIDIEREAKIRDEAAKRERARAASVIMAEGRAAGASEASLERIKSKLLGIGQ